jgi:hypothetical protein
MEINKEAEGFLENPLLIATVKRREVLDLLNGLIPYSTGFEIESHLSDMYDVKNFTSIPFIMDVQCDAYEQRFRIPNGIRGIICLYLISRQLRVNCKLNMGSGIHYHVDCTDVSFEQVCVEALREKSYILSELENWGYTRSYNHRTVGTTNCWLKFNGLKTFEFRIGEMTYDYSLLLNRIMHVNAITRYVKEQLHNCKKPIYEVCDFGVVTRYLKLPYSLASYSKDGLSRKLADIHQKMEKLNEKPAEEQITVRNRKHII